MSTRRRYRRRRSPVLRRLRRSWRRMGPRERGALVAAAAVVAFAGAGHAAVAAHHAAPSSRAAAVIAFARARLGCPYVWGGTGPCDDGYDCSGLVMEDFLQFGITFNSARPAADTEWQYGPQVSTPAPGDLVFFAGADGTTADPGHVGIVVDPAKHLMIDAYATGLPVEWDTYGLPTSAEGLGDPVGFTDPLRGS